MLLVQDLELCNKRVLVRLDLNVPIAAQTILDDFRILKALATIKYLLAQNCKIILMSHLGRPNLDDQAAFSLAVVQRKLEELLGMKVVLYPDLVNVQPSYSYLSLLENVRFNAGESTNCPKLAKQYAELADVFILDAFSCSHRNHASITGILDHIACAAVGLLFQQECSLIDQVVADIDQPLVAVIGGAKVSSKLKLLNSLAKIADTIIVGGGIANTFLAASGANIGESLHEADLIPDAQAIAKQVQVLVATDVIVADSLKSNATAKSVGDIATNEAIFDIGPLTTNIFVQAIQSANTIIWNGPLGVFEQAQFAKGTKAIANAIAASSANKLIGGGDTVAALRALQIYIPDHHISTAGGAFLSYLDDGFSVLKKSLKQFV